MGQSDLITHSDGVEYMKAAQADLSKTKPTDIRKAMSLVANGWCNLKRPKQE